MTKTTKKISALVLCVMLVAVVMFAVLLTPQTLSVAQAETISSRESRLSFYLDENVNGMNLEYETNVSRCATKTLQDFAGNTYTLIECSPTGYMIMCDDSATMVEYSSVSPSPYAGLTNELFYAGPSYFYVYQNGVYVHTITGEILDIGTSTARNTALSSVCAEMHQSLVNNANQAALNYINSGTQMRTEVVTLYGTNWTCVNNSAFFRNKTSTTQIGYMNGGYCGYIAAGLLIGYYDTFVRECMPDSYMTGSGVNRHFTGSGLTNELYGCRPSGSSNSTTSTVIRKTLNKYYKNHGYNMGSYDMITPFFSGTTLKNLVEDNTPSILFGDLGPATSPSGSTSGDGGNHAVVIYGYKDGGTGGALYSFLVHYGWSNYSMATVNFLSYSVFGSMYRVNL